MVTRKSTALRGALFMQRYTRSVPGAIDQETSNAKGSKRREWGPLLDRLERLYEAIFIWV